MKNETIAVTFIGVVAFMLGGAIGSLSMRWTVVDELHDLRAKLATANKDGKVCCDAAYVAIKYRPDCGEGEP